MFKRMLGIALLCAMAGVGGTSVASAQERTAVAAAAWVGQGRVFLTGENEALFVGAFGGILYVENPEGVIDSAAIVCPGSIDIDLKTGGQKGAGKCILTQTDADRVFADWTCDGNTNAGCQGTFDIIAGSGKFQGIKGSSPLRARTALREVVVNMKTGAVAEGGAGLLTLDELKYTLP